MKVALDTNPLFTGRGGVARYVRGLVEGFRTTTTGWEMREFAWEVENFSYAQPQRALRTLWREWVWAKTLAPWQLGDAHVLHHTTLPLVPYVGTPRHVVTLHDLAIVRHPERFRAWQRRADARRLRRVANADRVICVSRFTADEAIRLLGLPASRLEVVHHGGLLAGITQAPLPPAWPKEYFLFVGSLEPGKNLALLRDIYLTAEEALPPLLIVGTRWEGVTHEGTPPADWHFLGPVEDGILHSLYIGARALLFPSKYEGFGLPLLEAMQLGCPVLCGAVASLPEVGGDAVAYADLNVRDFSRAMRRLVSDETWRTGMIAAGRSRAADFSWSRCASATAAVYAASLSG